MKVLVSGGGTAGHISPILATADALKSLDKSVEILYVGQKRGMEHKIVTAAGWEFVAISAGKFRRYHGDAWWQRVMDGRTILLNLRDAGRVAVGLWESLRLIRAFRPDVIFLKGGYVTVPVGLAAAILRVPYVVHESDTVAGLTNRLLARWAAKVAVGWPAQKYRGSRLPTDKLVYTGNAVRLNLLSRHRLEGLTQFGFSDALPVVLVMGGSQGAVRVNQAVLDILPQLTAESQLIHVTGERDIERVRFEVGRLKLAYPERYRCYSFLAAELGLALAAADVVVSRAGGSSLAELAVLRKPTILIPGAHLTGGHQEANARLLARADAVRVIQEERLRPDVLLAELRRLLGSASEQERLRQAIGAYAVPDAPMRLARLLGGVVHKSFQDKE